MADKYVGKIVGVGTDNVVYVINIYQDETIERSPNGMIRHEGLKHFEMQFGGRCAGFLNPSTKLQARASGLLCRRGTARVVNLAGWLRLAVVVLPVVCGSGLAPRTRA